MIFNQIIVCT